MRKLSLIGGIAALALVPTFALAQSCEDQQRHQTNGTVTGAVVGGVAGAAVAGPHDRGTGAVIGGVLGAVIGNQATKPKADCTHAYGYYDRDGRWHATNVEASNAAGYYDRDGRWVEGAPNGYYDSNGRWMTADNDQRGYRDNQGRYVPAGAEGYYDVDGRYVAADRAQMMAANRRADSYGQYDRDGRWVASGATRGSASGYYDRSGQWVNGAPGGGYDANGRWDVNASSAGNYGSDVSYDDQNGRGHRWTGAPGETRARADLLEQRIRAGAADGSLSRMQANRALRSLSMIRGEESNLARRHHGLRGRDQTYIQGKLDTLSDAVRQARRDRRHN